MAQHFETVNEIGIGSFGSVMTAKKLVILKRIALDENAIRDHPSCLFTSKCEAAALLLPHCHPNIVRFLGVHEDYIGKALLIEMEYCPGGNLQTLIDYNRTAIPVILFPEEQVQNWLAQLCLAISFMHDQNIIHRNLKPSNIFVSKDKRTLKIGDFGVAAVLDILHVATVESNVNRTRAILATVAHMPPEILAAFVEGSPVVNVDSKTDSWSLGVILHEILTLERPFVLPVESTTPHSDMYSLIKNSIPRPIPQDYSSQLVAIINSMLTFESDHRATVSELVKGAYLKPVIDELMASERSNNRIKWALLPSLRQAAEEGNIELADTVIRNNSNGGLDLNAVDEKGYSALMIAASNGHLELMEWLVLRGANVKAITSNGWNSLMIATANNQVRAVRFLLRKGIDVNSQDLFGWSSLMIASSNGFTEMVKLLLKKKADVTLTNNNGSTAFDLAKTEAVKVMFNI